MNISSWLMDAITGIKIRRAVLILGRVASNRREGKVFVASHMYAGK